MICEHNFVTLESEDWLCHDCEIYFPHHPADMEVEDERWDKVNEILKGYEKSFVEHVNKEYIFQAKQKKKRWEKFNDM